MSGARAIRAIAALLLAAALLPGCADDPPRRAPAPTNHTPSGVPVVYPSWLNEANRALADAEIDAAGIPIGWTVAVEVPIFATPSSPTGLARGLCDYEARTLYVGWRAYPYEAMPVLPALSHEVGHIFGGPLAGH